MICQPLLIPTSTFVCPEFCQSEGPRPAQARTHVVRLIQSQGLNSLFLLLFRRCYFPVWDPLKSFVSRANRRNNVVSASGARTSQVSLYKFPVLHFRKPAGETQQDAYAALKYRWQN